MEIPPPKDWKEFEEITRSCLSIKWNSPDLTLHGRGGQVQQGVDIWGKNNQGQLVGVQVKSRSKTLKMSDIEDEIDKAKEFEPPLDVLYFATSIPRDASLQKAIRLESKKRIDRGDFPVHIFFWEDLFQELIRDEREFRKFYPDFSISRDDLSRKARLLSLIDIAYHGLNIDTYLSIVFGEIGLLCGEDPYQIHRILDRIKGAADVLFDSQPRKQLNCKIDRLINAISYHSNQSPDWDTVNHLACTIESQIDSFYYQISGRELAVFTLGKYLGVWLESDWRSTALMPLSDKLKSMIEKSVYLAIEQESIHAQIDELLKQASLSSDYPSDIQDRIYGLARRNILHFEMR